MNAKRILIVEDNERNLKLVRDLLEVKGYRVVAATSGEEALPLAQRDPPDLVVMDIGLPGMDGIAALRALRADPRTQAVPVIAVTASVMQTERVTIMQAGFDGYMGKPIDVRGFLALVQDTLDRST
ncbi:MAG: response regulator [Burkholderiales bacterium]|jgi:two-component system cell cycle response regulator DivK|nr:response regulator [Burkholderiales bacterium]